MREYAIGAALLDLDDPTKLIGALTEPLLTPDKNELWRRGSAEATADSMMLSPRMRMAREAGIPGTTRHIYGRGRQGGDA
jgi:hypothetical protein